MTALRISTYYGPALTRSSKWDGKVGKANKTSLHFTLETKGGRQSQTMSLFARAEQMAETMGREGSGWDEASPNEAVSDLHPGWKFEKAGLPSGGHFAPTISRRNNRLFCWHNKHSKGLK
ncbi:hypothetical protein CDAR_508561 [Caerostris darwini]|uniref:Uncharacterized protein n=1 Tax=Caerostris darwini TaxID=1538125 RepID=A0AAV4N1H8_9ARAC|nr:hypothetical protein CDAR_508561 [Caerostris darwini]